MHVGTLHDSMPVSGSAQDDVTSLRRRLARQADSCVACGMCLPVCPTYADRRDEAENARGRIALIRGLAENRLAPSEELVRHLDRCLQCQACEAICPAGVRYGELMDGAQYLLRRTGAEGRRPAVVDSIAWLLRTRPRLVLLGWFLAMYRRTGVQWLMRRSGLLRRFGLEAADRFGAVNGLRYGWRASYPAQGRERGRVALFRGCIANLAGRDDLQRAIELLRACGYRVEVPATQACCGAVDLHAGRVPQFEAAARRNLAAFAGLGVDTVVYLASGCGAVLRQYEHALDNGSNAALRFVDVNRFLSEVGDVSRFRAADPHAGAAFLHTPCSMRNATGEQDAPRRLLEQAGAAFVRAPGPHYCCGAAGTYSLRHPQLAKRLGKNILRHANEHGCTTLVTSNIGCALHLSALAKEEGMTIRVCHPVGLIESSERKAGCDD